MRTLVVLFLIAFSLPTVAFQSRDEAGLGFTDNAYLSNSDKLSDFYLKLSSSNSWLYDVQKIQLRVGFKDYFRANNNDLLNWRIGDGIPFPNKWKLTPS